MPLNSAWMFPLWFKLALAYHVLSDGWAVISRGTPEPRCIPIPRNLTLCQNMEYSQMRLPNNLDHETLFEVTEQASFWLSLLNLNCHTDAKLFLCSLFAPVCMPDYISHEIKPCQSLCLDVMRSCAPRMARYDFPWPDMLRCSRFPHDTGLCIKPQPRRHAGTGCTACNEVDTFENILDNFCRSTHVYRVKLRQRAPNEVVELSRGMPFKPLNASRDDVRHTKIHLDGDCRCNSIVKGRPQAKYLVMASQHQTTRRLTLNLLMPWNIRNRTFKKAVRLFKKIDCSRLGQDMMRSTRRNRARLFQRANSRRRGHTRRPQHSRRASLTLESEH